MDTEYGNIMALLAELRSINRTLGHHETLRATDEATLKHWREQDAAMNERLLALYLSPHAHAEGEACPDCGGRGCVECDGPEHRSAAPVPVPAAEREEAANPFGLLGLSVTPNEYAARILDDDAATVQEGIDASVAEGCEYMDEDEQWSVEEAQRQVAAYRLAARALRGTVAGSFAGTGEPAFHPILAPAKQLTAGCASGHQPIYYIASEGEDDCPLCAALQAALNAKGVG